MRTFSSIGLAALLVPSVAAAVPTTVSHQGRLFDATGLALEGQQQVTVGLWDAASGGQKLWEEQQNLNFSEGFF